MKNGADAGYGYSSPQVGAIEEVLAGLENALTVDLIATYTLITCAPDDIAMEVFRRAETGDLDQLPVRDHHVVGVLERVAGESTGRVAEVMKPLTDGMLVAADTGILGYIRSSANSPYHLVVRGGGIRGIVTPSDLLKLPVRTVLFTMLTHLESTMATFIQERIPELEWGKILKPARMKKLDDEFLALRQKRLDVNRLLLTEWCDKRDLVSSVLSKDDRKFFVRDLRELEELRNTVAHASTYETVELGRLVTRAHFWIYQLDHWQTSSA